MQPLNFPNGLFLLFFLALKHLNSKFQKANKVSMSCADAAYEFIRPISLNDSYLAFIIFLFSFFEDNVIAIRYIFVKLLGESKKSVNRLRFDKSTLHIHHPIINSLYVLSPSSRNKR